MYPCRVRLLAVVIALFLLLPSAAALAEAESSDPTLYDQVAEMIGNNQVVETYNHLKSGAAIGKGDKDSKLRGLQVLLNLFGSNLEVDGSIGEKSFAQLTLVQEAYSLTITESVTQADYEELMVNAYILTDPVIAGGVLGPGYNKQIVYVQGANHWFRGEYYQAREKFLEISDYRDSASRAEKCIQDWPTEGVIVRDSSYPKEDCQLIVKTNREDTEATYVKVYSGDVLVAGLFIPGSSEASVNLPKGIYTCKAGVGTNWYGPKDAFGDGDDATYQLLTFQGGAKVATLREGYRYTLTLGGTDESNVGTEPEDPANF